MPILYTHNPELDRENIEKEIKETNKEIRQIEIKVYDTIINCLTSLKGIDND